MHYRPRVNSRSQNFSFIKNAIIVFAVGLVVAVGTVDKGFVVGPIQNFGLAFSAVITSVVSKPFNLFSSLLEGEKLAANNRVLNDQYNSLVSYCATEVESLNARLSEMEIGMGRNEFASSSNSKAAYVIGKPPFAPYGKIIIDLGKASGIEQNDLAVVGRFLIGKVEDVFDKHSTVRIFGQKGDKDLFQVGEKRIVQKGEGKGSLSYVGEYLDADQSIVGEMTRLNDYPEYFFGKVMPVETNAGNKYEIFWSSPVNVFELAEVTIIKK